MGDGKLPLTDQEWREVVLAAHALRSIEDCRMYGLLAGGPNIVLDRVDWFIAEGKKRGIVPTEAEVTEAAAALVRKVNEEARSLILTGKPTRQRPEG